MGIIAYKFIVKGKTSNKVFSLCNIPYYIFETALVYIAYESRCFTCLYEIVSFRIMCQSAMIGTLVFQKRKVKSYGIGVESVHALYILISVW